MRTRARDLGLVPPREGTLRAPLSTLHCSLFTLQAAEYENFPFLFEQTQIIRLVWLAHLWLEEQKQKWEKRLAASESGSAFEQFQTQAETKEHLNILVSIMNESEKEREAKSELAARSELNEGRVSVVEANMCCYRPLGLLSSSLMLLLFSAMSLLLLLLLSSSRCRADVEAARAERKERAPSSELESESE